MKSALVLLDEIDECVAALHLQHAISIAEGEAVASGNPDSD
jgi:hypothetical protein